MHSQGIMGLQARSCILFSLSGQDHRKYKSLIGLSNSKRHVKANPKSTH